MAKIINKRIKTDKTPLFYFACLFCISWFKYCTAGWFLCRFFSIFASGFFSGMRVLRPEKIISNVMSDNSGQNTTSMNSDYRRTIKYLGIFGGAQGFSMVLNMVRNKFASILLGTRGLGFIALYNRTLQMFSECTNLSL